MCIKTQIFQEKIIVPAGAAADAQMDADSIASNAIAAEEPLEQQEPPAQLGRWEQPGRPDRLELPEQLG